MYTDENYLWGWVAYAAGVLCVLIVMWIFSRKWRFGAIRHLWLIITSVILLTPVTAYRDDPHLAPAFFVSLYEGFLVTDSNVSFQRALAPILAVGFFAIVLYGLARYLIGKLKHRKKVNV
jgi:hypothetical protein